MHHGKPTIASRYSRHCHFHLVYFVVENKNTNMSRRLCNGQMSRKSESEPARTHNSKTLLYISSSKVKLVALSLGGNGERAKVLGEYGPI